MLTRFLPYGITRPQTVNIGDSVIMSTIKSYLSHTNRLGLPHGFYIPEEGSTTFLAHVTIGPLWGLQDKHRTVNSQYSVDYTFHTMRPEQNGRHFANHIFKSIFFDENYHSLIKISLKFVTKGPINNKSLIVQFHWTGNKPLSAAMLTKVYDFIWWHLGVTS